MARQRESQHSTIWLVAVHSNGPARPALSDMGALAEVGRRAHLSREVFFHPIVTGVLLTAVIAAVMSTADSQLLLAFATDDLPLLRRISRLAPTILDGKIIVGDNRRHSSRSFN